MSLNSNLHEFIQLLHDRVDEFPPHVLRLFNAPGHGTVQERLGVYIESYSARLEQSLESDFNQTAQVLGDAFFELAWAYLKQYPSTSFSLAALGEHFADFISAQNVPAFVPSLAKLEWQIFLTKQIAANHATPLIEIGALSEEMQLKARPVLSTRVQAAHTTHSVLELWLEPQNTSSLEQAQVNRDCYYFIDALKHPVVVTATDEVSFNIFRLLKRNLSLRELQDILSEKQMAQFTDRLQTWAVTEWIVGFNL